MMNWDRAIERNRDALLRVVAMLFALAGLDENAATATLPRRLRSRLIRILRPAESATRRLIVIASRGLAVEIPRSASRAGRKFAWADSKRCATGWVIIGPPGDPVENPGPPSAKTTAAIPAFPLLDPRKRFDVTRRRYATTIPRVRSLCDDWSVPVYMRRPEPSAKPVPTPDDEIDATRLCRRLISLKRALDDLDGQAKRLARWKAKRDLPSSSGLTRGPNRSPRFNPMRPGRPPGYRKRVFHEVDEILRECHALAFDAERLDTS
ncbi:hypothetical protein [Oricola nitratireducens]|uniref:hypothetical protein n=1 Tax=Oricola nitratireducens TaxID=2775868 RepID=UPI001AEDE078|nr:hypothetical protein [Oricola nitratireducens]